VILALTIPIELAVIGIAVCIALLVWAVFANAEERSVVRESLKQLDSYEAEAGGTSIREAELLNPLAERAISPVMGHLTKLGRRFTPVGYIEQVRQKHVLAGMPGELAVDRFMAIRVVGVVMIPVSFYMIYPMGMLGLTGKLQFAAWGMVSMAFFLGPDARLNRQVEARQTDILRQLPDILDMLVIAVEAGLGFEQALDRTLRSVPGALSDEFTRMIAETRAGATRSEAMKAMEARIDVLEVRQFVLAVLQADTFGVSIGRVLRTQAEEMRVKRRQLAQEKAQKAPVKMLIPMVFCVFPALFVIILGPAGISISQNF
jgi:tight adherence protein C